MIWCGSLFGRLPKWIDKIRDEIFFQGTLFDDFFFVSDDDFVIGDFDDFGARDGELGVKETFDGGAFDDNLLDGEVVVGDGKVDDFAELGAFFGLNFEAEEAEIELDNFGDFDDVVIRDKLIGRIYD